MTTTVSRAPLLLPALYTAARATAAMAAQKKIITRLPVLAGRCAAAAAAVLAARGNGFGRGPFLQERMKLAQQSLWNPLQHFGFALSPWHENAPSKQRESA